MVLSYFKDEGKSPLILDNLSFKILSLDKREDLKEDLFINESGVYKLEKNNTLKKVYNSSSEFDGLMKKIRKEN